MNATKMTTAIAMAALLMAAGCGGREGSPSPTAPSVLSDSSQTASGGGGGGCGSAKETLTGAAINGVTPSGEAVADMSKFCSGGGDVVYHSRVSATQGSFTARTPFRDVRTTLTTNTSIPIVITPAPIEEIRLYASQRPCCWYV